MIKFSFDLARSENYVASVQKGNASTFDSPRVRFVMRMPMPPFFANYVGRKLFRFLLTIQGLGAFALITLGVIITKIGVARRVIRPLISREISRAGVRLLPMFLFLATVLGLLIIGQTVSWASKFGATHTVTEHLGDIFVIVVVRELGPLIAAVLVLARIGTANVVELGTARAMGEVEALEALGIDPVHYLVVPRVIGMAVGIFALTVYLIIAALASGYLWAFLQNVPLRPGDYFGQLAAALNGLDFVLLALKTMLFGFIIAIVTCYHGLAQPLQLEEVSYATVRAVAQSVIACVLIDALFIIIYLAT
ncbi:MAG TPA: ABC transporter permease [Candidatus Angelobacter sp.]|nr:ABC transporter permease [Candidatus Angelobacter sp.]